MDGGIGTGGGAPDVAGRGDVARHDLDPQGDEWLRVSGRTSQGTHAVATLDEELADVGTGQPGGPGDEDRLAHVDICGGTSAYALSTWSLL